MTIPTKGDLNRTRLLEVLYEYLKSVYTEGGGKENGFITMGNMVPRTSKHGPEVNSFPKCDLTRFPLLAMVDQ